MRELIRKYGKQLVVMITIMVIVVGFVGTVYAVDDLYNKHKGSDKVADRVKEGGSDEREILKKLDDQVTNIVTTVRVVATIAAVVFVIWIGIVFVTSGGHPQRLMQIKTQIAMFFLSLICIFLAEPIVRFILSWFG